MIDAKKPFTPELLQDLRLRCLSGARAAARHGQRWAATWAR